MIFTSVDNPDRFDDGLATSWSGDRTTNLELRSELAFPTR
jgi:hypothetical protein